MGRLFYGRCLHHVHFEERSDVAISLSLLFMQGVQLS